MVLDGSMEGWEEVPRDLGRERRRKRKRGKENKTSAPLHEPAKQILNHTKNVMLRKASQEPQWLWTGTDGSTACQEGDRGEWDWGAKLGVGEDLGGLELRRNRKETVGASGCLACDKAVTEGQD